MSQKFVTIFLLNPKQGTDGLVEKVEESLGYHNVGSQRRVMTMKLEDKKNQIQKSDGVLVILTQTTDIEYTPEIIDILKVASDLGRKVGITLLARNKKFEIPSSLTNTGFYWEPTKSLLQLEEVFRRVGILSGTEEPQITHKDSIIHEAAEAESPLKDKDAIQNSISDAPLATKIHSDHWSPDDYLGYERYAQTIEHIIRDQESKPPLTIGIIAPWGQGKTTLMRYVWRRFADEELIEKEQPHWRTQATPEQIKAWQEEKEEHDWPLPEERPCVWFNPWQYQSSEQIWAGMADAIIKQLVVRLPRLQQEKFWLQLQWKRIDKAAIRRDVHKALFTRLLPMGIFSLLSAVVAIYTFFNAPLDDGNSYVGITAALLAALSAGRALWKKGKEKQESIAKQLEPYLQSPDYSSKLGAFHHVNEDMQRVFDLLVKEQEPVLIFIDDLDRCSPQKAVEVIEAINLIMNARFRHKCYFIMGMDAEMVAAAIDVAYEKMHGKIPGKEQTFGSVGWYFLDKFIQLPFLIPTLRQEDKERLVGALFAELDQEQPEEIPQKEFLKIVEEKAAFPVAPDGEMEELLDKMSERRKAEFEAGFLEKRLEINRDSPEIQEQVKQYAAYLDPSPRSIKRFANLLRFHVSHQQLREVKGLDYADQGTLAIWLTLSLRWPQLVRWLQWTDERKFVHGYTETDHDAAGQPDPLHLTSKKPLEKAEALDKLLQAAQEEELEEAYLHWQRLSRSNEHLHWMGDKELLSLLHERYREESSLARAFECGVW